MIGFPSIFSRREMRRRPNDNRTEDQLMEVWLSPSRPPWGYVSPGDAAPWRVMRFSIDEIPARVYWFQSYDTFEMAIVDFAWLNRPRPGECCCMVDGFDQFIIGWSDQSEDFPDADEVDRFRWIGCKFAFDILEGLYPDEPGWAVNCAHWAMMANKEDG